MSIKAYFEEYIKNYNKFLIIFSSNSIYYRCDKIDYFYLIIINIKLHIDKILIINKDFINFVIFSG